MTNTLDRISQQSQTKSTSVIEKNPLNLAASWYVAMLSKELKNRKKPKAIQLFGRDLIAWRDENGKPVIMERYCSHMGASLALGEIKDGCVQCPFHHWHYNNSGNCVSIPNIDNIPPTARQTTYITEERYGFIWVWYGTSSPIFPLPEFPAAEDNKRMSWRYAFDTKTSVDRLIENVHDPEHITALHGMPSKSVELNLTNNQDSPPEIQPLLEKQAWFGSLTEFRIEKFFGRIGALAQGLGLNAKEYAIRVEHWPSGYTAQAFVNREEIMKGMVATTPIAQNHTIMHVFLKIKRTGNLFKDVVRCLVFGYQNQLGTQDDVPIWDTMKPELGGAYVKHDKVVLKFREYYQKWVNKAEV